MPHRRQNSATTPNAHTDHGHDSEQCGRMRAGRRTSWNAMTSSFADGTHRMTDTTGIDAEIAASHKALPETILEVREPRRRLLGRGRVVPGRDRHELRRAPRRGARDRRRVRVGQEHERRWRCSACCPRTRASTGSDQARAAASSSASTTRRCARCAARRSRSIFQEPMTALNPVYTIGFQIMRDAPHRTLRHGAEGGARSARSSCSRLVEMPDPEQAFDKYPHQLSGGQRQRAMIAQSISCDPQLLIADEPTTALDVTVQAEILELMRDLHKRLDSAIILITHDMGVVADLADRIMVMKRRRGRRVRHRRRDLQPTRSTRTRSSCSRPCRTSVGAPTRSTSTSRRRERRPDRPAIAATASEPERRRERRDRPVLVVRGRRDRVPEARPRARVPRGRSDVDLADLPRRDRRPGGRVRLGQDDDRARGDRPAPDRRGQARRRRPRHLEGVARRTCATVRRTSASCSRTRRRR